MRDVPRRLRLVTVDVDLLQNCTSNLPVNGRSTIAQADDLLKRVVRHGGVLNKLSESESRTPSQGNIR
jgi:hypothetical protein